MIYTSRDKSSDVYDVTHGHDRQWHGVQYAILQVDHTWVRPVVLMPTQYHPGCLNCMPYIAWYNKILISNYVAYDLKTALELRFHSSDTRLKSMLVQAEHVLHVAHSIPYTICWIFSVLTDACLLQKCHLLCHTMLYHVMSLDTPDENSCHQIQQNIHKYANQHET